MATSSRTTRAKPRPVKRHLVNVMLPTQVTGDQGQKTGPDQTVLQNVPCSIEPLNGRELEQARQVYSLASYRVTLIQDPRSPLTTEHYLRQVPCGKRLCIGFIDDRELVGVEVQLLCGEQS